MCDGIVGGPYGTLICPECEKRLRRVREPACKKCGKPLEAAETEYCADCGKKSHVYTRGMAALEYDGLMKASIGRFKYHNRREYADFYARELFRLCSDAVRVWEPDALIPIPLHRSRLRKRGFNQADLIARKLGELLDIPVRSGYLVRTKKTRPQKELNDTQRRANLKNAFQVGENDVKLKKALLIDDIYTTGSTLDAAAAVLLEHGVEKVYFLTVCIGRGF